MTNKKHKTKYFPFSVTLIREKLDNPLPSLILTDDTTRIGGKGWVDLETTIKHQC